MKYNIIIPRSLGVKTGDRITWHLYGEVKWITSNIAVINRIPVGQGITMTRKTLESLGCKFTPTSVVSKESITSYESDKVISVFTSDQLSQAWDTQMEAMNIMVYVMIFAAALLAVVVLYNLGLLSFTEREKELATLKVIGFCSKRIRKLLLIQNIWLATVGSIFGIPAGIWILQVMLTTSGPDFDMMTALSIRSVMVSAAITFGLSLLVNLMFSRKIKKLDMVCSLKGME
jgi:putative ABC transport system permease protein